MTTKTLLPLKSQTGVALVIALVIMIVLTVVALAATFTSIFEIKLSGNKRGTTDAFYTADGGVQAVLPNVANFYASNYVLIPDSSTLPPSIRNESIDSRFSAPAFSLPDTPDPFFTDPPDVTIYHTTKTAALRGSGFSAGGSYEFQYYIIDSVGSDQLDSSLIKSNCQIQEKVMRIIPTMQGG